MCLERCGAAERIASGMASTGHETPTWKNSGRLTAMNKITRRLAAFEPEAHKLGEKTHGQDERYRHEEQFNRPAKGGETVQTRQNDQIEREAGHREAEMRQRLAEDGARAGPTPPARASPLLERDASNGRDAQEQGLLQNEDESSRNDVACVSARRVEQRLRHELDGRGPGQGRVSEAAVGSRSTLGEVGADGSGRFGDSLQHAAEEEKIGRNDISGDAGPIALQDLLFGILRNSDDAEHLASRQRRWASARLSARTATVIATSALKVCTRSRLTSVWS